MVLFYLLEGSYTGVRQHVNLQVTAILEQFLASWTIHVAWLPIVNLLRVPLKGCTWPQQLWAHFTLEVSQDIRHITMHPLDMNLEFLRLAKLSATEITKGPCTIRISTTTIRPMHVQVVEAQKELKERLWFTFTWILMKKILTHLLTKLTLIRSFTVVHLFRVLHDILFAQYWYLTYFAVVLLNG